MYITIHTDIKEDFMDKKQLVDTKEKALRESGALNTHSVADPLFQDNDFFDPRDLVQVKYEMLRKVHKERQPISHVAASFGFSRPSFYQMMSDFKREGLAGLLPRKRGPRGGHKLTHEVVEFIEEILAMDKPMSIPGLLDEVEKRFGVRVHRRSLERARRRSEKKMPQIAKKAKLRKPKTMT
jgi:transposase